MKKKKEQKLNTFCGKSKCNCEMKSKLAKIFPYHLPNCLTESEYDALGTNATSFEELGEIYSRVFNSDNTYSEKRFEQLKRIRKEYI